MVVSRMHFPAPSLHHRREFRKQTRRNRPHINGNRFSKSTEATLSLTLVALGRHKSPWKGSGFAHCLCHLVGAFTPGQTSNYLGCFNIEAVKAWISALVATAAKIL